jgi:hypothetical protein
MLVTAFPTRHPNSASEVAPRLPVSILNIKILRLIVHTFMLSGIMYKSLTCKLVLGELIPPQFYPMQLQNLMLALGSVRSGFWA